MQNFVLLVLETAPQVPPSSLRARITLYPQQYCVTLRYRYLRHIDTFRLETVDKGPEVRHEWSVMTAPKDKPHVSKRLLIVELRAGRVPEGSQALQVAILDLYLACCRDARAVQE
jgi:hypothetical protein